MPTKPPGLPPSLYPAFAPLSVPMAEHLLLLEDRQYRRRPAQRPPFPEMVQAVLERVRRARSHVYDYLRPFVSADRKRQQRGESRSFPTPDWVLETLAYYSPHQVKNDEATLDHWQKRGLVRREKIRGMLDVSSIATLFIVRLAEQRHQRNWLPTAIHPEEPWWWSYGQDHPGSPVRPVPMPLPDALPASLILWTPWQGAVWEQGWQDPGSSDGLLYRWAKPPGLEDLSLWDTEIPAEIQAQKAHPLFGRPAVQQVLLEEARKLVLTTVVQKGIHHAEQPRNLFY